MSLILSRRGEPAKKLDPTVIEQEEYLQSYIHKNPHVLPLDELREDLRLSVLAREFPTDSGPIDALAVDDEGEVYLIETKLYRNPDKRQVLAQILDYGAALWSSAGHPDDLIARLEELTSQQSGKSLREKLSADLSTIPEDADEVLENVRSCFEEGTYRFVVLMDQIHDRLKVLLRFVNENSRFDIYGVELDFYRDDDLEILMPRLYGSQIRKQVSRAGGRRKKWDEPSFFGDVERRLSPTLTQAVQHLYEWSRRAADRIVWGTGAVRGSFNPRFDAASSRSIFTVYSDGQLSINYGWFRHDQPGADYAAQIGAALADVEALEPLADIQVDYPALPVERWAPVVTELTAAMEEALDWRPGTSPEAPLDSVHSEEGR